MLRVITDRHELYDAERMLREGFGGGASFIEKTQIGFQGGSVTAAVHWHPRLVVWGSLNDYPPNEKNPGRYWNAFGTQDPNRYTNLSITCEVNPPHEGINRRVAGVFARDDTTGQVVVLHRGRIGGGRKGISRQLFWRRWSGEVENVWDGRALVRCAVVADLGAPGVADQVAKFVRQVSQIKA